MYAIAGVTGHTGKIVAETMLARGEKIRVIVRNADKGQAWAARGAQVAIADLADANALATALTGTQGAYLLLAPDMGMTDARRKKEVSALASAVKASGVPHVVLLSSVAAHLPSGTGPIAALHDAEQALRATGTPFTAVRAAYFVENLGAVLPAAQKDGALPSFLPADLSHEGVATVDIGKTAAQALLDGPRGQRIIELSGPQPISANLAAAELSSILGRKIAVHVAPTTAVVPVFTSMGVGPVLAALYQEMMEGMISGKVTFEGGHERARGTTPLATTLRTLLG